MKQGLMLTCRFSEVFGKDEASLPRRWGPRDSITAVMHKAYHEVAVLLAQIAVIRLGKSQVRPIPGIETHDESQL